MSRIGALVEALCPDGVPYRRLGEVANITTGERPSKEQLLSGGVFAYMNGGVQASGSTPSSNTPGGTITIPSRGSVGIVGYQATPFWCGPLCYRVRSRSAEVGERFLYFWLKSIEQSLVALQQTGSIPALNKKELETAKVPVPPFEVQREIVGILDTFSELDAELEAELEARRVQYAYYRDLLMLFNESSVRRVPMGDLGIIFGGLTGKTKADFSHGNARFVSYVNIFNNIAVDTTREDFVRVDSTERQRSLRRGDVLLTGSSETAAEVGVSSVVTEDLVEPLYLNSFCIGFRLSNPAVLEPDFTKHLFRSDMMRKQLVRTASGVTRFNVSKARLAEVEVPIPPLEDQRRIASILDKFESLTADLSAGLPAELRARRQQFEYYRDRLLTFKELPGE